MDNEVIIILQNLIFISSFFKYFKGGVNETGKRTNTEGWKVQQTNHAEIGEPRIQDQTQGSTDQPAAHRLECDGRSRARRTFVSLITSYC